MSLYKITHTLTTDDGRASRSAITRRAWGLRRQFKHYPWRYCMQAAWAEMRHEVDTNRWHADSNAAFDAKLAAETHEASTLAASTPSERLHALRDRYFWGSAVDRAERLSVLDKAIELTRESDAFAQAAE